MTNVEVICVGGAKFDHIAMVDALPTADGRILVDRFETAIGGQAITAAVAIARLGVQVGYCGVIGRDAAGDRIMERLEEEGISRAWVERRAEVSTARSTNLITRSTGARAIITERAISPDLSRGPELGATWLHFDDAGFCSWAAAGMGPKRPRLSIDGGNPIPRLDLHGIDLYAPTIARLTADYGADLSPRELMQKAINDGARQVVATDGARGSYMLCAGDFALVPGFGVKVVSTLGAGDVFHGALLAALCMGKPMHEALVWANACAALSCRALDGQSMTPTRVEVERFLSSSATTAARGIPLGTN